MPTVDPTNDPFYLSVTENRDRLASSVIRETPLPKEAIPLGESFAAAYRRANLLYSVGNWVRNARDFEPSPGGFNPFKDPELFSLFPEEVKDGIFDDVVSPAHLESLKQKVLGERRDREILASSGWVGFAAAFAAGLT